MYGDGAVPPDRQHPLAREPQPPVPVLGEVDPRELPPGEPLERSIRAVRTWSSLATSPALKSANAPRYEPQEGGSTFPQVAGGSVPARESAAQSASSTTSTTPRFTGER